MNQDKYSKMVKDGWAFIEILQSVPEDKRFLLKLVADAFANGMKAQEQLMAERPSA